MELPNVEVSSTDSVTKLAETMLRNNVSSILIAENGNPLGVISDKEILREIVEKHRDPTKTRAKDLQYTPLVVLDEAEAVTNALKVMREMQAKRVAVVKNGQLVGMLTEKEVSSGEDLALKTRVPKKQ
jgi:signal-transduction protein with cAMP-binding, CBS, and nucleotidyltransferase domain